MTKEEGTKNPKSLTWERLTGGGDLRALPLPEFGGDVVWLRPLPARPVVLYNDMPDGKDIEKYGEEECAIQKEAKDKRQYEMIAEALVGEDGKPLAPDGDVGAILDLPMTCITQIMSVVTTGKTIEETAKEKNAGAEGNESSETPGGDSPTD